MKSQSLVEYAEPLVETEAEEMVPQGTEVLVRVSHCGVCHSDVHLQDGYFELGDDRRLDVRSGRELPFTLGHEIAGEVASAGPEVTGLRAGESYVIYPWIGCGNCGFCANGEEHLCQSPRALGIDVDGGYATHVLVPHPRYLLSAEGIDPEIAGSYMCSGLTAYSALKKVVAHGRSGALMIIGAGGVGLMCLQFAKAMFETDVLVADINPAKREAALELGASAVFDPGDREARRAIMKATGGGVVAAIDFAGTESSLDFAQRVAGKGGLVVVVGLMGGKFSLPGPMFAFRALTVTGGFAGSIEEAREMLDLVRSGAVTPIPVELRPLGEANRSLDDLRASNVVGRIVLTP